MTILNDEKSKLWDSHENAASLNSFISSEIDVNYIHYSGIG